jgi:putative salt-induced outer membrane protein YdiY
MRVTVCLAVLFLCALDVRADEIVMKNGDKITGKVVDLAGGRLKVETSHSGVVTVDWAQVASLKTDGPVKVRTVAGETFEGKIAAQDGRLRIESAGGETHELGSDRVKSFNEAAVAWHGSIDFAGRTTDGNTHNTSMLLSFDAMRASENDRITLKAVFRYGETSSVITERNSYAQAKYDYLFSETLYGYASGELMSDKFRDLKLRWIAAAGVGSIFLKSPEMDFWGDVGLAYIDNDFRDGDDESHAGARISAHFRRVLPLGLELVDDLVVLPNFEEGDDWQARNDLAVSTALGGGWALKAGMITDYDNDPPDGLRKYDDIYYVGLGYKF